MTLQEFEGRGVVEMGGISVGGTATEWELTVLTKPAIKQYTTIDLPRISRIPCSSFSRGSRLCG